ncbi:MAG: lipocalin family protein [Deltaproteobacteria bacterium]
MHSFKHLLLALTLGATMACGSSDTGAGSATAGQSTSAQIVAANGGEMALGTAKLSVRPGALAQDAALTIDAKTPASSLPSIGTVQGLVYDFGPNGTTFSIPAELTLPLPATPKNGEHVVLSWLDTTSNTWQDVDATVSGKSVTASVSHFTMFVVRLEGGSTGPVDCSFNACGGSLVGTWRLSAACIESDPDLFEDCPQATVDAHANVSGTMTFNANSSYNINISIGGNLSVSLPTACLDGQSCASVGEEIDASCTSTGAACSCTTEVESDSNQETGTYATTSNTFTFIEAGDDEGYANEYCVTGNTLKISDPDGEMLIIGTRQ